MLTDKQIEDIALKYTRVCGGYETHEEFIPDRDVIDFARAIEKAVQMGHCEDCVIKGRIEQLEKEKANLYGRCLEYAEAMYDAVIKGNDNHLIELVEQGVNKI